MGTLQKYTPFFVSALLMCVVLYFIYPHYQYYIDPDGTAYLTISQRYANGDYLKAVNGYWSPWSCWLTALLIKAGLAAIPASVFINAVGASCFLYISQSLFRHFGIVRPLQWMLCITLALFLCYAIFWQSFDDLWECFFLLLSLRLMQEKSFEKKFPLWILCGAIGALAYFAKSYSFPFFILNTICCSYFICKGDKAQWLKISIITIGVMLLCSMPWLWALHNKYGIWTTSTAGSLNMSWYLVGHPHWKEGIDLLIPPAYPDSPYYWEDPYLANGGAPHFWDSLHLFGLQILRIGYNLFKLLISSLQLSIFFPVVAIAALVSLWSEKISAFFTAQNRLLVISFLLFPLGYLLINYESRYLWYMLPLSMVLGGLIIQSLAAKWHTMLLILFPVCFLIYPAYCMGKMYDEGAKEYSMAQQLKNRDVHGSFAGMVKQGKDAQRMERLAYFSGIQLYSYTKKDFSQKALLAEMKRYQVNYYFILQPSADSIITNEQGNAYPDITNGAIIGLKVLRVN